MDLRGDNMSDTGSETISRLFFNQIKNLSKKKYIKWKKYSMYIDFLDNLHYPKTVTRLEVYR